MEVYLISPYEWLEIPAKVYCRRAEWGDQADDRDGDVPGPGGGQALRRGDQYTPDSLQAEIRQPQVDAGLYCVLESEWMDVEATLKL